GAGRDEAFQSYCAENLDMLREVGAELVFWSPLTQPLPSVDGLYFGGGYPEIHAARLAGNASARDAVRAFAEAGRPIYAECGGVLDLAATPEGLGGGAPPLVRGLPTTARVEPPRR